MPTRNQYLDTMDDVERVKRECKSRSKHYHEYWKVYEQEEYKCPNCRKGIGSVHSFEVHHKDEDPMNGDFGNLIALCRECHYKHHGREPPKTLEDWKGEVEEITG